MTRLAVPVFLMLSIVTLAFGLGYIVHDLADDGTTTQVAVPGNDDDGGNGGSADSVGAAILNEIYNILDEQYVDPEIISEESFRQSAIDGVISSLNDPHTDYISPSDLQSGALELDSTYQGIGASVTDQSGQVEIVAPFRDSPAQEAGIRAGDVILEVDGVSTEGWTDQEAVQEIRGPAGTDVTLTVEHPDGAVEEITITRGDILIESVFTSPPIEVIPGQSGEDLVDREGNTVDDIAYVNISQFHDQTLGELRDALSSVEDGQYEGLIVDVRSNPGGLLTATVDVVDEFLESGDILHEVTGDGERQTWSASAGGVATEIPIVVLQDQASASGSEVLAAALKDNGRAQVIGTRSFGKGTVNQLRRLENCGDPDGCGALYLSVWPLAAPQR
ncbi:MAG: S41 family peptidase [Dehalococcoidia bacterium]|nr:S41 family peptidase [Dehalococcoidia bacterium]